MTGRGYTTHPAAVQYIKLHKLNLQQLITAIYVTSSHGRDIS